MRKNDDLISRQDALSFLRNWERVKDYSWGERNIIKATINEIESLPSAQPDVPDTNVGKMDGDELDEAIRHCDEIVQDITWFCNSPSKYIEQRRHKSAVKLRQLASWLRELKRLRTEVYFLKAEKENEPVDLLGDVPCKTCKWRVTTTEKCEECIDGVSDNYEEQEPCEDCVSRQAAIDAALSAFSRGLMASPDIRKLPSVHPKIEERKEESAQNVPKEDLISRKVAIDAINKALDRETLLNSFVRKVAVDALKTMPSAEPEIIRCKDCKYRGGLSGCYCDIVEKMVGVDSFCSWAERRTDGV